MRTKGTALKKLNLGCFTDHKPGYINIDIDPHVNPDIIADARDLSMFPDMSCSEILASHLLEHFYEHEITPALREWNRLLVPGGRLILVVPDVQKVCQAWHNGKYSDDIILRGFIGDDQCQNPWMLHKTFFWWSRLERLLAENNYEQIQEVNKSPDLVWLQVIAFRK